MDKNGNDVVLDPALALSRAWAEAHARTLALCLTQQQLETELAISVGFPSSEIYLPDGNESEVTSLHDMEDVLDSTSPAEGTQHDAVDALSDHVARWRAKDAELGYSAAKEAERQAACKEQLLLDKLAITPARTLAGVIAKLAVMLRDVEDNRDASDFPLLHIRSVLEDLTRIIHQKASGGSKPSSAATARAVGC